MFRFPSLSPDGKRISMLVPVSGPPDALIGDIWTVDTQNGVRARLTSDDAETPPVWSPDGTRVVFAAARGSPTANANAIYERAANSAGVDELLFRGDVDENLFPTHWSRSAGIAFHRINAKGLDIWLLPTMGDNKPKPLVESNGLLLKAQFSPDGKWIAFSKNEPNGFQVAVQPVSGQRDRTPVGIGADPHWRSDGRELYFMHDDDVMVVDVEEDDASFHASAPRKLFSTGDKGTFKGVPENWYDVSADGERFLVIESLPADPAAPSATPSPKPIHVLVNWTAGLTTR